MKYVILLFSFLLAFLLTACSAAQTSPTPAAASALILASPAFHQGDAIPEKYTCLGDDSSPELKWSGSPTNAQSLALLVEDPDAPGGTWVHWLVYNLPPDASGLSESASSSAEPAASLPAGAVQGKTSFGRAGYGGPCPPSGQHHYYFHLYALDIPLEGQELDKAAFLKAIEGHILAQGELMGVYQKP